MRGHVTNELDVDLPADEIWAIYRSPEFPKLILGMLPPGVLEKLEVVEGDGGAGCVLHIILAPGSPEPREWMEEFVEINNEKKVKRVRMIQGGFLDLGFNFYENVFEITEIDECSCVYKSSVIYEADDNKFSTSAPLVSAASAWGIPYAIANHIMERKDM
ncbi:hypothetical protein Syun_018167 [Stephania yunnanensis]|uniref:Bet v I/Major latex protein domain-containing protein n=1 Tax=Stephania yunnanensis TaxID=152371 RepID=A0AAP0NWS5_9MAGN